MARTLWETIEGNAGQILNQLKRVVDEGNARRVVVKQRGKTIAEFPLTAGVIRRSSSRASHTMPRHPLTSSPM